MFQKLKKVNEAKREVALSPWNLLKLSSRVGFDVEIWGWRATAMLVRTAWQQHSRKHRYSRVQLQLFCVWGNFGPAHSLGALGDTGRTGRCLCDGIDVLYRARGRQPEMIVPSRAAIHKG